MPKCQQKLRIYNMKRVWTAVFAAQEWQNLRFFGISHNLVYFCELYNRRVAAAHIDECGVAAFA